MPDKFSDMDTWTSEQIAIFKEMAKEKQKERIQSFAFEAGPVPLTIVAEGDSWFDYLPGTDIIDCLREHHNYVIDNYAKAGDTLENMIYGTGINKNFQRVSPTIDKVLRKLGQLKPKVFLFSGGGNDVAGDEFESYLNHKSSGLPTLREEFVNDMINRVFRKYLQDLIDKVAAVSDETHIVTHGYGHTTPTGEGVDVLFFTFAGPWLKPALAKKGIFDYGEQRTAAFTLIDNYNEMLAQLADQNERFHYVNLREIISPDQDWANELHLRNSAFARAAESIHLKIQSIAG